MSPRNAGFAASRVPSLEPAGTDSGTDARSTTAGTRADEAGDEPPLRLRGDEPELYLEYNAKLIRRVRWAVAASPEDIEDACAFAWVQFLRRQPDRDRPWRSWLFETARRQAWRLAAQRGDTLAIVDVDDDPGLSTTVEPADPRDRTEQALEFQAALQELAKLPERLQAVVFIRSQSSTQAQVAEVLGVSPQRIDQLLRAAGLKLRDISERRIEDSRPVASPRAARLRELEDDPPKWLVDAIGKPPTRTKSSSGVIVAWRRAALAVDDYRKARGVERAPSSAEAVLDLAETHERARRAVEHLKSERERRHGHARGLER